MSFSYHLLDRQRKCKHSLKENRSKDLCKYKQRQHGKINRGDLFLSRSIRDSQRIAKETTNLSIFQTYNPNHDIFHFFGFFLCFLLSSLNREGKSKINDRYRRSDDLKQNCVKEKGQKL